MKHKTKRVSANDKDFLIVTVGEDGYVGMEWEDTGHALHLTAEELELVMEFVNGKAEG